MVVTSLLAMSLAQVASEEVKLMRYPAISGDQVVFSYASDLWTTDRQGGFARRLTSHPGNEAFPFFSPDGKWIAFSGQYDGGLDVYVMPAEGGEPRRLTYDVSADYVAGWTPDGRIAYTSNKGQHTNRMDRLWFVRPEGGMPEWTPVQEAAQVSFAGDGRSMAYTRNDSHVFNWRRYRGGTQGRIAFWNFTDNSYSEVPAGKEQNHFPMYVGDFVYFISDRAFGTMNLYRYGVKTKKVDQLTTFSDGDIRWPNTDGKQVIFERNGRIHTYNLADGKIATISARVISDQLAVRPVWRNVSSNIEDFSLSPSGKRLTVTARGEIFSVPARTGETRNMTASAGSRQKQVTWTPDGQTVAYLSDASGEWRIMQQPQMGGPATEVPTPATHRIRNFGYSPNGKLIAYQTVDYKTVIWDIEKKEASEVYHNPGQGSTWDWSPDSNWLVYTMTQPNLLTATYLYDVRTKRQTKVTEGYFNDDTVAFDQSGKFLYIVSSRQFGTNIGSMEIGLHQENVQRIYLVPLTKDQPNPLLPPTDEEPVKGAAGEQPPTASGEVKIDLDGLESRMMLLPFAPGTYPLIQGVNNGLLVWSGGTLSKFDVATRSVQPIMQGVSFFTLNASKTKMAYAGAGGIGIADVRPGLEPGTGRVDLSDLNIRWDPRQEWKQMFWEVWRHERDEFYDANMLGLNWKAIGDKYAAMLPSVGHRSDLNYIFGMLIGELGTGHAYVQGGDMGSMPSQPTAAMLGADFESEGRYVKVKRILTGVDYASNTRSPLAEQGVDVRNGDYLVAINGNEVTTSIDFHRYLVGKAGKTVTLHVNRVPSMEGARKVVVRPISNETQLRYTTWVEENRKKVEKMSDGKIGYMHVPNTSFDGIIGFVKGFYSQTDKLAWVIDERYNGGGFIPTFFGEYLQRQFVSVIAPRHGANVPVPSGLVGPKAMLINEYAGSGGDMFPYLFKKAKLGPLIGTRTWGGLVGIQGGVPLVDGGSVTAPGFGIYDADTGKWMAENTGVDPDILVDDRPDLAAKGQDPQLEKALEYLTNELKKSGVKFAPRPPAPTVGN